MFRTALQLARLATAAVTGVVEATVSTLTGTTAADAERTAPDPADVFNADELPTGEEIAAAAAQYAAASDAARAAERTKRAAKKLVGRLPAGLYGRWLIERVVSTRQTPDLDAIRAAYKRHGLGEVPMKEVAPSLRVTSIAPVAIPAPVAPVAVEHGVQVAA
ncbi:hypothetical protein ACGFXC_37000 [Streptomyces sp. NPDC048507]|uniref:hypothetical protein n=1 Tax=Streptomyces sp. NPDC048507 TaxID=3365560 RepID=UPI0037241CC0